MLGFAVDQKHERGGRLIAGFRFTLSSTKGAA